MLRCAHCGQDNPAHARFCLSCGRPLTAEGRGQERKTVTMLFCDLVGFTPRTERDDPEDVQATLSSYFAALRREVDRFEGTVEKYIGDAVPAIFGAPIAHEDDPERALRCAFAMLEAIERLNRERPDLELTVRIGLSTGEALVSPGAGALGQGIVTGDVVNTAARLQQVAPPGGVVVSDTTYFRTREMAEFEPVEAVVLKGKAEPQRMWRAIRLLDAPAQRLRDVPFIGRDDEIALLHNLYRRALHTPSLQLVTIMGEPGVGKTRLLREFGEAVEHEGTPTVVHGRCLSYGAGVTYWAFREIVQELAGILESDGPDDAQSKLDSIVRAVAADRAEADWIQTRLAPLVGAVAPEATSERPDSFAAWSRLLEGIAGRRPLVVVVEDLHWAGEAMLAFLEYLAEWSEGAPLLVACTARPELLARRPGWGGGQRNATTITLAPLSSGQTSQLVSALLAGTDSKSPAEPDVAELADRAGGNPLYAEELAQMVREGIVPGDGRAMQFPQSLQAIIASRLDSLPPEMKALLQDASVVGKVFWSGALAAMSGLDPDVVRERLHELTRRELVRPSRTSSVKDQEEFGFWHMLIRDVTYGQIPRAARAAKHRAAGDWIRTMSGDRLSYHAELLAHHYGQSLELSRASGEVAEADDLREDAVTALVLAGQSTIGLDPERALAHLRHALELMPSGHSDRGRVLARAAEAAVRSGQYVEAESMLEQAVAKLRSGPDVRAAGYAMVRLSNLRWHRGDPAHSRSLLHEGIGLLESGGPSSELAAAYSDLAATHAISGSLEDAVGWADKALAMTDEVGSGEERPRALAFRGGARCHLGDLGGLDDLREAVRTSRELGLPRETARIQSILAEALWETEGPAPAMDVVREAIALAEERGSADLAMEIRSDSLGTLFDLGRWDELIAIADLAESWFGARGGAYFGLTAEIHRAMVSVYRGDVAVTSADVERFIPIAREIEDLQVLVPALVVGALARVVEGQPTHAAELIEEIDRVTAHGTDWYRDRYVADLVRAALAAARPDLAEGLALAVSPVVTRNQNGLATAEGLLAEAKADLDQASERFTVATDGWARYGSVLEEAQARFALGRCLPSESVGEARANLAEARRAFEGLGAAPLCNDVDALIRRMD